MMRTVFTLTALAFLTAAAPQGRAARDWTTVATKTATGAYVIGNPRARVKLVEYASYTCSHCADFANQSGPVLKDRMIRSGDVSLEFRHVVFNAVDLAAAVTARCTGPANFAATTARFYQMQDQWLARGAAWAQANAQRLSSAPATARLRALADGAGLTGMTRLTPAAVGACFADEAEIARITAMRGDVGSTPTFFLNGKPVAQRTWAELQPQLRAAGAR
jgi:protein-disulfide isomerase